MYHIKDEDFVRGKIPMTKEEVRAISIAKLEMKDTDIIESRIEVPRGTLYHSYALESGRVRHSIIRTPSMANIGAMQYACIGDQITDAQLCIVQCDPCFTCTDRAIEIIRR